MLPKKLLAVGCAAFALAFAVSAYASSVGGEGPFQSGMEAYQSCQYADALTPLTLAAHPGHRRVQEVAGR